MPNYRSNYPAPMPERGMNSPQMMNDWSGEISGTRTPIQQWEQPQNMMQSRTAVSPQMQNNLSPEVVETPTDMNEAYLGSLKAMLLQNKGNYVVATFLIGTQSTVSWEGILYEVGNDYVTIYQPGRDRYVVIDMYSLKYIEFYDTRRREQCDTLLAERGLETQPSGIAGAPKVW